MDVFGLVICRGKQKTKQSSHEWFQFSLSYVLDTCDSDISSCKQCHVTGLRVRKKCFHSQVSSASPLCSACPPGSGGSGIREYFHGHLISLHAKSSMSYILTKLMPHAKKTRPRSNAAHSFVLRKRHHTSTYLCSPHQSREAWNSTQLMACPNYDTAPP